MSDSRYLYIGCYSTSVNNPALPTKVNNGTQTTVSNCLANSSSNYAGMTFWEGNNDTETGQCYNSDSYTFNNQGLLSDDMCIPSIEFIPVTTTTATTTNTNSVSFSDEEVEEHQSNEGFFGNYSRESYDSRENSRVTFSRSRTIISAVSTEEVSATRMTDTITSSATDTATDDHLNKIGDQTTMAIYQRILVTDVDTYQPIDFCIWSNNFIEISTKYAYQFGLKLVSDGKDVYFDTSDDIVLWKAEVINSSEGTFNIIGSNGVAIANRDGNLVMRDAGEEAAVFVYDSKDGTITTSQPMFGLLETIGSAPQPATGQTPPQLTLLVDDSIQTKGSLSPTEWIVPGVPSGSPTVDEAVEPNRVFEIVAIIALIVFIIIMIGILVWVYSDDEEEKKKTTTVLITS